MRLGLIARADDGGLGSLTREFARHLKVERALIVDLGHKARGETRLERIKNSVVDARAVSYPFGDEAIEWLVKDLDVVYTAETPYNKNLFPIAEAYGCRVILHAMPELLKDEYKDCEVWLPTTWYAEDIKHTRIMPVPIATDRFTYRRRSRVKTALHIPGEAMLDRNGTDLLIAALPKVNSELRVIIAGSKMLERKIGNVTVVGRPPVRDYWQNYDNEIDLLIIPRRYGGLCLPVQEAAACGIPALMLEVEPQTGWPVVTVPAQSESLARMAGGNFNTYTTSPDLLASVIDRLCTVDVSGLSAAVNEWAQSNKWSDWIDPYNKSLGSLKPV